MTRDAVVIVPPLAEEMNKSRRMFSLLAEQLSANAMSTTVFDLTGTGDSSGEFADATWPTWLADLDCVITWLHDKGYQRIHLLGLRLGALLAADYIANFPKTAIHSLVFWQPVLRGEMMLNQFLRLRLAANMMGDTASETGQKETTKSLRDVAKQQGYVEIAGYDISSQLMEQLDELDLSDRMQALISSRQSAATMPKLHWFEMVASEGRELSPASKKVITGLSEIGLSVNTAAVVGDSFWNTQEITTSSDLIRRTVSVIRERV